MTTPHHAATTRPRRAWAAFRRWRQSRPFWGGLLLLLAGIELFWSGSSSLGGITISTGPQGFLAYVLPALLLLCGLLSWLTPAQRIFYAVIAALTALYALIGLNLGGWFLGTLLGVVGSAMTFGWAPGNQSRPDPEGDATLPEEPNAGEPEDGREDGPDGPEAAVPGPGTAGDAVPAQDERGRSVPVETRRSGQFNGGAALVLLPLLLASSVGLATVAVPRTAHASACTGDATVVCQARAPDLATAADTTPTSEPTPGQTTPTAQPTGTAQPPPTTLQPTPAPGPSGTGPTSAPTAGPSATTSPVPTTRILVPASNVPSTLLASPSPGQGLVTRVPATMTASVLTLLGFAYGGIATLPTASGPIATLKFTMDLADNQKFELMVGDVSRPLTIKADPLVAQGHVTLYTTSFSGKLLGIPLTFTPDAPPPIVAPVMVFTDVSLNLVYLECDVLKFTSTRETGAG